MVTKFSKIKILHTAFLYGTGLRSSNITHYSVLNRIFDTSKMLYCILSDQYTNNSSLFLRADTDQEETLRKEAVCRILIFWFI